MNKITLASLIEFQDFLEENIPREKFEFKYLVSLLDLIFIYRKIRVNINSFIIQDEDEWILFIETDKQLFMYESSQNQVLRNHFLESVNLANHIGKEIMGTYELVTFIVEAQNISHVIIKDRNFLTTNKLIPIDYTWNIERAREMDLNEIVTLHQRYYEDEYNNTRNKSSEELLDSIATQIQEERIFIVRGEGEIVSFCSIAATEIGIMYTLNDQRGRGLAQQLLNFCTNKLLENQEIVYVMTDMYNAAANRVCEKSGFKTFYKHSNIELLE